MLSQKIALNDCFHPWKGWENVSYNLHFVLSCLVAVFLQMNVLVCSIFTGLLCFNWLISGGYKGLVRLKGEWPACLLLLFYLLHVVGLAYSSNWCDGLVDLERKSSLFLIPLVLLTRRLSTKQRDWVVILFIFIAVVLSIVGLARGVVYYDEIVQKKGMEHLITYFADMHRVYFSMYLLFCYLSIFFYYQLFQLDKKTFWKFLAYTFLFLIVAFILIMTSRMVVLLLIGSSAIVLFYFLVVKKRQYIRALVISLVGLAIMAIVYSQVAHVRIFMGQLTEKLDKGQTEEVNSVNIRVVKYKCAVEGIKNNWLLGVGTGDIQDTLNSLYRENHFHEGYRVNMDAHNQYLQTWLGLGIPGIVVLILFIILSGYKAVRERNYLLLSFISIFAICCVSESLLTTQKGIVFVGLIYPLVYFNRFKDLRVVETR